RSGRIVGFADLWPTEEPDPFGRSLNVECIDYFREYFLDGTLADLRARVTSERRLTVDLANENGEVSDPDAEVISRDPRRVTLRFDPLRIAPADLIARIAHNHEIRDLFVENPPIEEIIAKLYGQVR
ncbi:MAG: hypothetical protein SVV80_13135, partial [Planctomycetota bacterium]|nr:hypothetical protein [Planctomycetota bacterium]